MSTAVYSTQVIVTGGRAGTAKSEDGQLSVTLSFPKFLGGTGAPGTNPEQLFAAGYGACFESTLHFMAQAKKVEIKESSIMATASLHPDPKAGFLLSIDLEIRLPGLDRSVAESLIADAKKACPYHKMANGNIEQRYMLR